MADVRDEDADVTFDGEASVKGEANPRVKPFTVRDKGNDANAAKKEPAKDSDAPKGKKKPKKSKKKRKEEEEPIRMQLLRLQADFDNFRKRTVREKTELYTRANEDLMEELLPVLDHMEMALAAAVEHEAPEALTDGFSMVQEQLLGALKKSGLSMVDNNGAAFDPNVQEAISHLASPDVPEGGIVAEVRRGYKLGKRLLRPAQVVVSSGPQASTEGDQ